MSPSRCNSRTGFSLVELIATLTVVGILAVFAIPRLAGRSTFESRGVYDQTQAAIRYAQKIAIAQRRSPPASPVYVSISAAQVAVCYDVACTSPVLDPGTGNSITVAAPNGIAFSPATSFSFSGSGAPSIASQLAVTVTSSGAGDSPRVFYVEAGTGYVHE